MKAAVVERPKFLQEDGPVGLEVGVARSAEGVLLTLGSQTVVVPPENAIRLAVALIRASA